jgi:uncharacterized protein YkwD
MSSKWSLGKKKCLAILAIALVFISIQSGCSRNRETDRIQVVINEEKLVSDVDPIIINSRTMLPMRAVFEALGAKVEWNEEIQTAKAIKDGIEVELVVGEEYAVVNGEKIWLDSPSVTVSGRMFVPVRFVAETFGMEVSWDEEKKVVTIEDTSYEVVKRGRVTVNELSLYIGQSESELLDTMGNPARKDRSEKGFLWYIYNSDYSRYIQVGIEEGKVVAIYTNSNDFGYDYRAYFGMMSEEIESKFPEGRSFFDGKYDIYLDDQVLTLFIDVHESNTVTSILLTEKEVYSRSPSKLSLDMKSANEKQLIDLSNAVRSRYGLAPFTWNENVAAVARAHSEDMSANNFFAHENLKGESPFDRMEKSGLVYMSAAENIAAGYPNAIYAHEAWMNSGDHRVAILAEIEQFGAGIAQNRDGYIYYTENFYTPR